MTTHRLFHNKWPYITPQPPIEKKSFDCVFMDPPDNIGLNYGRDGYPDNLPPAIYYFDFLMWMWNGMDMLKDNRTMWVSFNAIHTIPVAELVAEIRDSEEDGRPFTVRPMVQRFTFGQHRYSDFGNGYRPLWRFQVGIPAFYSDSIRIESERQKQGDKRANPQGRIPDDVFDIPRVVGNSKQRRAWHPTQLNEALVERCILSCTREGDTVLDLFSGTGTVIRVCKRIGRNTISMERSLKYCHHIAAENDLDVETLVC